MMKVISTDGTAIAFDRTGTGPAIILSTWKIMTSPTWPWRARRSRKLQPSASAWVGALPGFRLTRAKDLSGDSIFFKDEAGQIFHTYSTFGRGGEEFLGIYRFLDLMPKGRDEKGPYRSLADWARPKNIYGKGGIVEGNGGYHAPGCACAVHK
jgi:predicted dithiol-disulfide oxidoreductase (DUF899 family)